MFALKTFDDWTVTVLFVYGPCPHCRGWHKSRNQGAMRFAVTADDPCPKIRT